MPRQIEVQRKVEVGVGGKIGKTRAATELESRELDSQGQHRAAWQTLLRRRMHSK